MITFKYYRYCGITHSLTWTEKAPRKTVKWWNAETGRRLFLAFRTTQQLAIKLLVTAHRHWKWGEGGFVPPFFAKFHITISKDLFFLVKIFRKSSPPPTFNQFASDATGALGRSLLLFSVASTSLQVSFQTGVRPSVETERNYGFKMHCILTWKKINGDGDVGVFLQLARLCGTRVDVDAVYFTHDRPWKQKRYSGY